jgi:PDZ domain-containing secreted protein
LCGFSSVQDINGEMISLNEINDLEEGDRITSISGEKISSIEDLKTAILNSNGEALKTELIDINRKYKTDRFNSNSYR